MPANDNFGFEEESSDDIEDSLRTNKTLGERKSGKALGGRKMGKALDGRKVGRKYHKHKTSDDLGLGLDSSLMNN